MTRRTWNYDSYAADETAITTANHTAVDGTTSTISSGTGGTTVADLTHRKGASGYALRQTNGSSAVGVVDYTLVAASPTGAWRGFITYESLPTSARTVAEVRNNAGQLAKVSMLTDGSFRWQRGSGATSSPSVNIGTGSATGAAKVGTMRWEITFAVSAGATSDLVFTAYDDNTNTVLGTATVTDVDLFASGGDYAVTRIRTGAQAQDANLPIWLDEVVTDDTSAALIGPIASSTTDPPTAVVSKPAPNVIDASKSVAGAGGTLTLSIAQTSGTSVAQTSVATGVWVIPQSSTASGWTVTVAESPSGQSVTATTTVPASSAGTGRRVWTGSAWA